MTGLEEILSAPPQTWTRSAPSGDHRRAGGGHARRSRFKQDVIFRRCWPSRPKLISKTPARCRTHRRAGVPPRAGTWGGLRRARTGKRI